MMMFWWVFLSLAPLLAGALAPPAVSFDRRAALGSVALAVLGAPPTARAAAKLSDSEVAKVVTADIVDRQFLATADFTRSLYDEKATFTDEIDSYTLEKFVSGTKKLFDASKSRVDLTSPVTVDAQQAAFSFREDLCFNVPFKPVVSLSGRVELKRDPVTGLFTSYREFWDQSPREVLLTAKFK